MFWTNLKSVIIQSVRLVVDSSRAFLLSSLPILILTYAGYYAAYHYLVKFVPGLVVLKAIQGMDPISLDFVNQLTKPQQINLFTGCLVFVTLLSLYYVGFTVQWARFVLYGEKPKFSLMSFRNQPAKQYTLFLLFALLFFTVGMTVIQLPMWGVVLTGNEGWFATRLGAVAGLVYVCVLGGYMAWFFTKLMLISIAACGDQYQGLIGEFKKLDDVFWSPFLSFVSLLVLYTLAKIALSPFMWVDIVAGPVVGLLGYATAITAAGVIYKSVGVKI